MPTPQTSILTGLRDHALFLTIKFDEKVDRISLVKSIGKFQQLADGVSIENKCELDFGVGFSHHFYKSIGGRNRLNFSYTEKGTGEHIMRCLDGDIYVHAKSDNHGALADLALVLIHCIGPDNVKVFDDVYGFKYKSNRDLTGFIDGINNPRTVDERALYGVDKSTGGSYCVAQKWEHKFKLVWKTDVSLLESWIGRKIKYGDELKEKSETSHIARMKGGNGYKQKPKYRLVRHSHPYGAIGSGPGGLVFLGYSNSLEGFEFMLNRMTGLGEDGLKDDLFNISTPVGCNYWYFPSIEELAHLCRTT
ncbi:hypothetical protein ACOME3_005784 [Neoechinorhynchus agilis]